MINHFQNHNILTTKHLLFENIASICEQRRINVFEFLPITFTLQTDSVFCPTEFEKYINYFVLLGKTQDINDFNTKMSSLQLPPSFKINQDKFKLLNAQSAKFTIPNTFYKGHNVWVLKATGFNRGMGIHVFNTL